MTLGLVTVGQAPRTDVTEDLSDLLDGVRVVEHGALDGFGPENLERIAGAAKKSLDERARVHVLQTRLADGRSIVYRETDAIPLTQQAVGRAARDGASAVLIACTGTFPPFDAPVPVLYPQRLLQQVVLAVHDGGPVALLTPDEAQREDQVGRWSRVLRNGTSIASYAVSPYRPEGMDQLAHVATTLNADPPHLVVMDCIGYTRAMRARIAGVLPAGRPVLTAREVAVRMTMAVAGDVGAVSLAS